jgi:hypothetical protein
MVRKAKRADFPHNDGSIMSVPGLRDPSGRILRTYAPPPEALAHNTHTPPDRGRVAGGRDRLKVFGNTYAYIYYQK